MLGRIQDQSRARAKKRTGPGGDDGAVLKLDSRGRNSRKILPFPCRHSCPAVLGSKLGLLQNKRYLIDFLLVITFFSEVAEGVIVSSDDR